jgi:hypothetical protein
MHATRLILIPLLAVLACHDRSNDSAVEQCEPTEETFLGLFNSETPWVVNSGCDEIFVCADPAAAQTLNELLDVQCQVHVGPDGCNGDGEVKCILATDIVVTEQHIADACTALTVPGIDEVWCPKICC